MNLSQGPGLMLRRLLVALSCCLSLSACAGASRTHFAFQDRAGAAPMGLTSAPGRPLRFYIDDPARLAFLQANIARGLYIGPDGHFDMLALSGGGANGAFSAGVITGWTQSGLRPDLEVVTGVSTGALAAPFVFLGPAWDMKLREAYTGGVASRLLRTRGLATLFGSGIYSGAPLRALVDHYVDDDMLRAVAAEAAKGRILLVATTDLDAQRGVSWDMGAIAQRGGPEALALFRAVLVASASIPGAFPPALIPSYKNGVMLQEMHVDGGVTAPFLALPEGLWADDLPRAGKSDAHLYVIVNGRVGGAFEVTRDSVGGVVGRSVDTLMRAGLVGALAGNKAFASRNNVAFRYAALPDDSTSSPLDFSPRSMQAVFELGRAAAANGTVWR